MTTNLWEHMRRPKHISNQFTSANWKLKPKIMSHQQQQQKEEEDHIHDRTRARSKSKEPMIPLIKECAIIKRQPLLSKMKYKKYNIQQKQPRNGEFEELCRCESTFYSRGAKISVNLFAGILPGHIHNSCPEFYARGIYGQLKFLSFLQFHFAAFHLLFGLL